MNNICRYCGSEYEAKTMRSMYCSTRCCRSADRDNKRMKYVGKREQVCVVCGVELPKYKTRYCSDKCRIWSSNVSKGVCQDHGLLTRQCVVCGKEFKTFKSRKITCSEECRCKNHWISRDKRYKGITIDSDISLFKLAKRDNNICQICGLEVNWEDKNKVNGHVICGRMYPSIDHVKPISKGGLHSWNNVQLAHIRCNSSKCNRYVG